MSSLILTIICSTTIALILKSNAKDKGEPIILLFGNYAAATMISLFLLFSDKETFSETLFEPLTVVFGSILGLLFVLVFFIFAKAVDTAGAALATISSRLSVIIPILMSIILYHEYPGVIQLFGFALTILTIAFFYLSLKTKEGTSLKKLDYFYLFAVLIGIGIVDFALKLFEESCSPQEKSFFLFIIFFSALLYSMIYVLIKKVPFYGKTIAKGLILGIPNIFSSFFLLDALSGLQGIIVYPVTNIGIILLTSLGAIVFFRERINYYGKLALLAGLGAILLLTF